MYVKFIRSLLPKSVKYNLFLNTSVGEKHVQMYDKFSLKQIIKGCGFKDIKYFNHNRSQIPEFRNYNLDTNEDGSPYKGESSIYCETKK